MHFIYFLGRFHVLAVHLPITLILVVAALEWLTRKGKRPDLQPAVGLAWAATALTAILTVILGYMHFAEGGFQGATVQAHRALGTAIAVVSTVGWIMHARSMPSFQKARAPIVILLVALVVVTGHLGGNLTHGSGYLTQYAPNFIREMAGLPPSGPRLVTIDAADPYVDVVSPVLEKDCNQCHNGNKQKGGLDMSTYAKLMKGGGDGPVIVAGNAKGSDLIRRVSLPQTSDDYMPKGQSPLSADQIAVLTWWINSGAKTGVKVLALNPPAQIRTIIQDELNPTPAGATGEVAQTSSGTANLKAIEANAKKLATQAAQEEAEAPKQVDPKVIAGLVAVGFMVRPVSLGDPQLVVSPTLPGSAISAANIQTLATVSNNQIVDLNLALEDLSDSDIAPIAHLTALEHLRLDDNKLTDQSVQALSTLPNLVELNLYDNQGITDAAIPMLAAMKSLKRVYLWHTGITQAGITKLHKLRPDMEIDAGDMSVAPASAAPAGAGPDPHTPGS